MQIPQELIRKKREGGILSTQDIQDFFGGYLKSQVSDYQMSAMLMAIFFNGMTVDETSDLTDVMVNSGTRMDWSEYQPELVIDKHSTGGIGDKTSLILLPLCILEGLKVPMMSGRGLGHTGGTLDKLESIPGVNVKPTPDESKKIMAECGGVFMGQTSDLAPLDQRLYALRDVTATVESIPLITGSILSKKIVEGISSLVMDVKYGSGAFMSEKGPAEKLAQSLLKVGTACGLKMSCILSSMNNPLGDSAGNSLEMIESVDILKGNGPNDTTELSLELAAEMVALSTANKDKEKIKDKLSDYLKNGKAFEVFCKIIKRQGGDISVLENTDKLKTAKIIMPVFAPKDSNKYVEQIDVRSLGVAVLHLGGGRKLTSDKIDHSVGLTEMKKIGDQVDSSNPLAVIHANDNDKAEQAKAEILSAYKLGGKKVDEPLIWKTLR